MAGTAYIARGRILRWREGLSKKLPRMVDWFNPMLLGMVGVRTLISTTIGQYADQRPVQAMMDSDTDKHSLALRHDYSSAGPIGALESDGETGQAVASLPVDADGALWVDFIADLGDGFEATYAMAHLMAQPTLEVRGADTPGERLPGAELIILGGDLAYPNATVKEYQDRCLDPYNATVPAVQFDETTKGVQPPEKKLFFFAGNHDWYDGLAAFTSVFCQAGDTDGGIKLGKWKAEQRRSYFGLKLPHGWWVLAVDTGLNDSIDEAQERYFKEIVNQTVAGEKIIVMTHAPGWVDRLDNCVNVISDMVRRHADKIATADRPGPEIRAYIAGDLHHYSRYIADHRGEHATAAKDEAAIQLITSGGGGAFLHPTHQLKRTLPVSFTGPLQRGSGNVVERNYAISAQSVYPSRMCSRLLTFKNLLLPFRNWRFAALLGLIYFLYAWVYQLGAPINALPASYADIVGREAAAARQAVVMTASQDQPTLQRFIDLAGRQIGAPDLLVAAGKAKSAADAAASAIAKSRATGDAIIARDQWEVVNKQYEKVQSARVKAMAASGNRDISAEEKALKERVDALHAKHSTLFPKYSSNTAKEQHEREMLAAYKAVVSAIDSDKDLAAEFERAAPKLVGLEAIDLAPAAQVAGIAIDKLQSAIQQAKPIAEKHEVLLAQYDRLESAEKRGMWEKLLDRAMGSPAFFFMLLALWFGLFNYVDTSLLIGRWLSWLQLPVKMFFGTLHFMYHVSALIAVNTLAKYVRPVADVLVGGGSALYGALSSATKGNEDKAGEVFLKKLTETSDFITKCWSHSPDLYKAKVALSEWWPAFGDCLEQGGGMAVQLAGVLSLALTTIVIGGMLGGLIFGLYWVSTTAIFGMHMDAFSALGMRDYKNFLRLRFDKNGDLAIYSIGLKRVPGPSGWRGPTTPEEPQVVPKKPLRPHLIEKIVIAGRSA